MCFKIHGLFCTSFQTHLTVSLPITQPPPFFFPTQGLPQAFVQIILQGLPQNPVGSWENDTYCCYALITALTDTLRVLWLDRMLFWPVTVNAAVGPPSALIFQALQFSSTKASCLPAAIG